MPRPRFHHHRKKKKEVQVEKPKPLEIGTLGGKIRAALAIRKAYKQTKAAEVNRKARKWEVIVFTGTATFGTFALISLGVETELAMKIVGGAIGFFLTYLGVKEGVDITTAVKKGVELSEETKNKEE